MGTRDAGRGTRGTADVHEAAAQQALEDVVVEKYRIMCLVRGYYFMLHINI